MNLFITNFFITNFLISYNEEFIYKIVYELQSRNHVIYRSHNTFNSNFLSLPRGQFRILKVQEASSTRKNVSKRFSTKLIEKNPQPPLTSSSIAFPGVHFEVQEASPTRKIKKER